jgi:hypothetical protein
MLGKSAWLRSDEPQPGPLIRERTRFIAVIAPSHHDDDLDADAHGWRASRTGKR